ncbi:membrane protein, major facilitator superfamily [Citrifermentans bemidjiense Bem]|uniref:Membrane protein, major facilitator superfamily n=1 Tax=Citrifermentans bemidjiense (strain ATCC BAA-1014 / DSM 16622 / JCM 12645 / Bem) TaxID=404380 RepID=B5EE82_CITBB|nr:MFS transporter [Citrifermentans bemidjiense]ACH39227.1 membrane protein, major facilitator superfamily [Citrifermentans bemidjiense Bem]
MQAEQIPLSYRRYALGLLLAVNLLNYIDRQVLFAVFPLIKADLNISDTELGLLGSAFMLSYMVIAPVFGWLGDHWDRVKLASSGVVVWSLATVLAGFAPGYRTLLSARATVGVGEASFGTVSPGLIADFFPKDQRGRILSWFYVAIPVGSAMGYLLGGVLGHRFGWHAAFLMVGLPGMLLALPLWFLRTPERGGDRSSEEVAEEKGMAGYLQLFRNRAFVTNTLAMAAMTFAIGGLAQWIPTFLFRVHAQDVEKANTLFGSTTVLAGILGTLAGGWLGDRWQKKSSKGYLLVSGWGFFIGAPFAAWAIMAPALPVCMAAIFVAEFFLFLNTGPLNTVIINVTRPAVRAMAFAVNIFFIHALGDAVSPSMLGWLSDQCGLRLALLSTPLVMALAGVLCFVCGRYVAHDMAQAEP